MTKNDGNNMSMILRRIKKQLLQESVVKMETIYQWFWLEKQLWQESINGKNGKNATEMKEIFFYQTFYDHWSVFLDALASLDFTLVSK